MLNTAQIAKPITQREGLLFGTVSSIYTSAFLQTVTHSSINLQLQSVLITTEEIEEPEETEELEETEEY